MSRFEWKDGVGIAYNAFPGSEFIRSTDAYFRPVWTENGPDGGALHRRHVSRHHPGKRVVPHRRHAGTARRYVEDYRKNKLELWVERYERIKKWGMLESLPPRSHLPPAARRRESRPPPRGCSTKRPSNSSRTSPTASGWWRDTAQALIVSRGDKSAVPALAKMAADHADRRMRASTRCGRCRASARCQRKPSSPRSSTRTRACAAPPCSSPSRGFCSSDADICRPRSPRWPPTPTRKSPRRSSSPSAPPPSRRAQCRPHFSTQRPLPLIAKLIERDQKRQVPQHPQRHRQARQARL